ncbi:MAG: GNAT family N-acetyltransferase [Oscillospiraceae bacterium]|nr:GNAT family N-acetyltransferase [Oscillospiraceae bacterium]
MKIIEYFSSEKREHWLSEIEKSDWSAGKFLFKLLKEEKLKETVGENAEVILLTNEENLVSFCTFADFDDIQPTGLTPWIGFVYTFPEYRGNRNAGKLLAHAEKLAKKKGFEKIHISTNHIGLYEKYGYNFFQTMKDIDGEDSRVYIKNL